MRQAVRKKKKNELFLLLNEEDMTKANELAEMAIQGTLSLFLGAVIFFSFFFFLFFLLRFIPCRTKVSFANL
jgi:hypothetical protein